MTTWNGEAALVGRSAADFLPRVLSFRSRHGRYSAVKRREFITLIGSAAAAWPLAAAAQQPGKLPTIGFLGGGTPTGQRTWAAAFVQRLRELGRTEARTFTTAYPRGEGPAERL